MPKMKRLSTAIGAIVFSSCFQWAAACGFVWALTAFSLPNKSFAQTAPKDIQLGPLSSDQKRERTAAPKEQPSLFLDAKSYAETGQRLYNVSGRVIGGIKAPTGAFPWMVSIGVAGVSFPRAHFCGGSLIGDQWVVTAAHCFNEISAPGQIVIKLNTNTLSSGGEVIEVAKYIIHPNWNKVTFENDVTLIKLAHPVSGLEPIKIITDEETNRLFFEGLLGTVAGWGRTQEGGAVSDDLREVGVQIVANSVCNSAPAYPGEIKEGMFCAGVPEGGKDSARGIVVGRLWFLIVRADIYKRE